MNINTDETLNHEQVASYAELAKIAKIAEKLSVWKPVSVTQEPHTILTRWRVYNVMLPGGSTEYTAHFVGDAGYEGRVSSPIMSYDETTKRGVSRSGRVYELAGASGNCQDAAYVFGRWLGAMLTPEHVDVTDDYERNL